MSKEFPFAAHLVGEVNAIVDKQVRLTTACLILGFAKEHVGRLPDVSGAPPDPAVIKKLQEANIFEFFDQKLGIYKLRPREDFTSYLAQLELSPEWFLSGTMHS